MLKYHGRAGNQNTTYISNGLRICILLELEEDRVGHGEMKGWDGPVCVEGVKYEPKGQQSRDADGYETKDGILHLVPQGSYMGKEENK